jgi:glutathione S-transferase
MKLYGSLASNNVRRSFAVALHLGLEVELLDFLPFTPETSTPEFRRLSPSGRVPVLVDGTLSLTESHAIMLYFTGLKPNTLWPTDDLQRAQVMMWMSWALAHWHPGWQPLQWENFIKPQFYKGETDQAAVIKAEEIFHREARILDDHLRGCEWLVGPQLTLADFSVAAGLGFWQPSRIPLDSYAQIHAWYSRMEQLPAWRQSAPRTN